MATALLGLGSNVGDRAGHLAMAHRQLMDLPRTSVTGVSRVHETAPVGPPGQGPYLNMAIALATALPPRELVGHLQAIESAAGRVGPEKRVRWGPRELDIDLLLYDQQVIHEPDLTVPHAHMHERRFVLQPLAEIALDAMHPVLNKTVAEMLKELE